MSDNFLDEVIIKKYRCLENIDVSGLSRINLISGKNNSGKTSFLEALFLLSNSFDILKKDKNYIKNKALNIDREEFYIKLINNLLVIEECRKGNEFLIEWLLEEFSFDLSDFELHIRNRFKLTLDDSFLTSEQFLKSSYWDYGSLDLTKFRENRYYTTLYKKNHQVKLHNFSFISSNESSSNILKTIIDELKLTGKNEVINKYLKELFNIDKIDIIKNKIMLQQNGRFQLLSDFGEGLKHFVKILLLLLVNKDSVVFIDEIENGIHFELIKKIWEIIFKISKEQNIQLFITTHSKENIEYFYNIVQELKEDEISFINLSKDENNIIPLVFDKEMFCSEIEQNHEVRAW